MITGIRRRSKYLLLDTDAGLTLLVHLGMTGQLWVADRGRPQRPHEHVVLSLGDGRELRFADARRFGLVLVLSSARLESYPRLKGLGPDPLDDALTGAYLFRATRGRRKPVKNFLMDTHGIRRAKVKNAPQDITFQFCTECLVDGESIDRSKLRGNLSELGN